MLDGERKSDGQVEGTCQIREEADGGLRVTIQVKNVGKKPIFLQDVDYIRVNSRDEFVIDGKTMETWRFIAREDIRMIFRRSAVRVRWMADYRME